MKDKIAFEMIQKYVDGWKRNDLSQILSSVTENCVIVESHGPTYEGVSALKKWFQLWTAANSSIQKWDIFSYYFCQNEEIGFIEWDFSCVSNELPYAFKGISKFKLFEQKICFIHEYRMTHAAYLWEGKMLDSD